MNDPRLFAFACLLLTASLATACVGESAEPECTRAIDCPGGDCVNGSCTPRTTDGDVSNTDATAADTNGEDTAVTDVTTDVTTMDADAMPTGNDASSTALDTTLDTSDTGSNDAVDMADTVEFPEPGMPQILRADVPFLVRDVAPLGRGLVVAGTTPPNFEPDESREAVAVHYDNDAGVVWAARIGDTGGDQFTAAATNEGVTLLAGASRGYSVTNQNNSDIFLVTATEAGFGEAFNFGTADDEVAFDIAPGGALGGWIVVGEHRVAGSPRDVLVAAFDDSLSPVWAYAVDLGGDDYASSVAVSGDTVFVVGSTNSGGEPEFGRAALLAVDADTVRFALFGEPSSRALSVHGNEQGGVDIGARVVTPDGLRPAWLSFDGSAGFSGEVYDIPNATIGGVIDGPRQVLLGQTGELAAFALAETSGGRARVAPIAAEIITPGFLPIPVYSDPTTSLAVLRGPDDTIAHVPLTAEPKTACPGDATTEVGRTTASADAFSEGTFTATRLDLEGGTVVMPRQSTFGAQLAAGMCTL